VTSGDSRSDISRSEAAVIQVLNRYCIYFDRAQITDFVELWTEDCELLLGGTTIAGRDAIRSWAESAVAGGPFIHLTTNSVVDWTAPRECRVKSYVVAFRPSAPSIEALAPAALGTYEDRLVFNPKSGAWLLKRREITLTARRLPNST
jgi:hypothetical protein